MPGTTAKHQHQQPSKPTRSKVSYKTQTNAERTELNSLNKIIVVTLSQDSQKVEFPH